MSHVAFTVTRVCCGIMSRIPPACCSDSSKGRFPSKKTASPVSPVALHVASGRDWKFPLKATPSRAIFFNRMIISDGTGVCTRKSTMHKARVKGICTVPPEFFQSRSTIGPENIKSVESAAVLKFLNSIPRSVENVAGNR